MQRELFEALLGAPGGVALETDRGLIRAAGSDRVRFLNGMLTCDVASLEAGQLAPGLQLDRRGHVSARLDVLVAADEIWLDADPGSVEPLLEMLEKHVIADDVRFERVPGRAWLVLEGPAAAAAAGQLGGIRPPDGQFEVREGCLWIAGGLRDPAGVRCVGPAATLTALARRCELPRIEADAAEILRIEAGVPRLGTDTGPKTFPQEARLDPAVSYSKGCYIGQEIVARIHSRGAVNRLLVQLVLEAPVEPGDEIRVDGRGVGQISSAAVSPVAGPIALGYVRREQAEPDTAVEVGATRGRVTG